MTCLRLPSADPFLTLRTVLGLRRAAVVVLVALTLAGCGGGGGDSAPPLAPATTPSPSPAPSPTPPPTPSPAAPQVSSIAPTSFSLPARLNVTGTALDAVAQARLNGTALTIAAQSATSLALDVPGGASSGFLTLIDRAGASLQAAQPLTVIAPLAVASLSPGSLLTGATLTIGGSGLDRATAVEFSGGASAAPGTRTGSSLAVTVPAGAQSGPVTVVAGSERAQSATALTVIPRITVSNAVTHTVAAGGSVTLNGSGFGEVSGVNVGTQAANITSRTATQLVFTVPDGASCAGITLLSSSQPSVSGGSVAAGGGCTLRIEGIEFAQVLSQAAGDPRQRLVPRRETWVRAFVVSSATGLASPSVTLTAYSGATPLGSLAMNGPAQVPTLAVGAALPASLRYSQAQTWMVRLEDSWVGTGLRVEVTADAEQRLGAPVTLGSTPVVGTGTRIDLVIVPLVSGTNTPATTNAATLARDELTKRMPVPAANISVSVRAPYTLTSVTDGVDTSSDWSSALSELEQLRDREAPTRHYYGLVRPMVSAGTAGIGYVNGVGSSSPALSSLGWDTSRGSWLRTLVHELGHNYSRSHAPCGSVSSSDPNYPYAGGALGSTPLFDVLTDLVVSPTNLNDVMGYCSGNWFSDYNLAAVQRFLEARPQTAPMVAAADGDVVRIAAAAPAKTAAEGEVLVIAGRISLTGAELAPVQVAQGTADLAAAGEYQLRLLTAAGTVIEVPFDAVMVDHAMPPERHFLVRVPNPGPLAGIEVLRGNGVVVQRMAERATRASAAAAAVAAPPSVTEVGGRLLLQWDAAAHPVATLTHVGRDGRRVLALGASGGRAEFDADLPAGGHFELALSDGLNTTLRVLSR